MTRAKGMRCGKLESEPGLADLVVKRYQEGASLKTLVRDYGLGREQLRSKLVERGVTIRTSSQARSREVRERSGPLNAEELTRLRAALGITDLSAFKDEEF